MITAVDTNVLIDVFADDPTFRDRSVRTLRRCLGEGTLVACDVVWAETVAGFPTAASAAAALAMIPVAFDPIGPSAAAKAGATWREHRTARRPRERPIADFMIGAHALEQADRLLTRDRGFYRAAFRGLVIVDPTRE